MKKLFLLTLTCILSATFAWAADVSYSENFSKVGNVGNSTSDWYGDLCTWHRTNASHRTQDTIAVKTRRAVLLTVSLAGSGKLETTDWEGGIKAVSFKYARFGSENTEGRVLQLNVAAGSVESPTATYAKNAMKQGTGGKTTYETYDQALNCKEDAQLVIDNISTYTETNLTPTSSICRILVADIVITPYILYTQKEATIGAKQQGYVNQELLQNSDDAVTYSSSDESIAKVDPSTGEVTPVSVGDVLIYASLAEGAKTHYTLHVVNNIVAENFSKVIQTGSASNATWHGDIFDWKANAARRGANDTIKSRPIERQQATWFSKDGYVESKEAIEGGIKNISFTWRQWSAKVEGTTTKVSVSYGGEVKAGQEFADLVANTNQSFNEDINCASAGVLKIQNTSYTTGTTTTVNNRIVIENIKITPYLLYTTKEYTLDTRVATTYTNLDLINNTGEAPVFSVSPTESGVTIDAATGDVTAADDTQADFTVTATWGAVTTTYVLHVTSRTVTEASYPEPNILEIGLNGTINKELEYTAGYDGTIVYASSNEKVAKFEGGVLTIKGVGQTTISATLPQTDNYKAAEASYILRIIDNSASVQVEAFTNVEKGNAATHAGALWEGDVYEWRVSSCGAVRKNGDKFASDQEREGIWMGTPDDNSNYSSLTVENGAEGGIKHLWFYCEQPYNTGETGYTLKPVVYLNEATVANKVSEVEVVGTSSANSAANRTLFGASNVTKSNSVLIIRNESYLTDGGTRPIANRGRFLLDQIHITPYLLYTTKETELDLQIATTYTNADLIDNTESGSITYTLEDNDGEASIDAATGEVTGIKAGQVTVKATWSEGAYTTYTLNIVAITETEASYPNAEIHATMGEAIPANDLVYPTNYDGEIGYASSVPTVADFENGVLTLKAPGQTKITATLPETSKYTAATASYILTVSYSNYESFDLNTTVGTYAKPEEHAAGDQCEWYAYIGGIQTPNYFTSNAITTRAQRSNETNQGYVKSEVLQGGISALAFNYSMMYADNDIEKWDIRVYVNDRMVGQLTNEAGEPLEGVNGRTLKPMPVCKIEGINEPGNFVIRFENHSTIKEGVEYTSGNKGRFAIDNVSWESYGEPIVLNENVDNSAVLAVNSGSVQDVTIIRSPLQGGKWNTLCLPFAISKSADLGGADVQVMTTAKMEGEELLIGFAPLAGDELEAGMPYLVKPASNVNVSGLYTDKTIASINGTISVENGMVQLKGIFSPFEMEAGDQTTLFVGTPDAEGRNLYYPSVTNSLKGFRAYFKYTAAPGGAPAPKRARFMVDQEEVATGVEGVQSTENRVQKTIENGQLIIIREGKKYNVQGARVQ